MARGSNKQIFPGLKKLNSILRVSFIRFPNICHSLTSPTKPVLLQEEVPCLPYLSICYIHPESFTKSRRQIKENIPSHVIYQLKCRLTSNHCHSLTTHSRHVYFIPFTSLSTRCACIYLYIHLYVHECIFLMFLTKFPLL